MFAVKKRAITVLEGTKECPTCGRLIPKDQKHRTVTRIVRVGNNYGDAHPGDRVEIELDALTHPVQLATMSLEEHDMLQDAAKKPKVVKKSVLSEMVDRAMAHAAAEVKSTIERGKRRLERARELAIAEGRDLPPNPRAVDAEPLSREHKEVV